MATRVYGSYETKTVPDYTTGTQSGTITYTIRNWFEYTLSETNTAYTLKINAGYQIGTTNKSGLTLGNYFGTTFYLTGTGQSTVTAPICSANERFPIAVRTTTVLSNRSFTWNKTSSAASKTVTAYGNAFGTNKASHTFSVPAWPRNAPTITNIVAERCEQDGTADDEGTYARVKFNWSVDTRYYTNRGVSYQVTVGSKTENGTLSGASGSVNVIVGTSDTDPFDTDTVYNVTVKVTDSYTNKTGTAKLTTSSFPIDINSDGTAVGILRPAPEGGSGLYTRNLHADSIDTGIITAATIGSVPAGQSVEKTLTFSKTFTSAPVVVACLFSDSTAGSGLGSCSVTVHSITTTNCKVKIFNDDSSARNPAISWIAILK